MNALKIHSAGLSTLVPYLRELIRRGGFEHDATVRGNTFTGCAEVVQDGLVVAEAAPTGNQTYELRRSSRKEWRAA